MAEMVQKVQEPQDLFTLGGDDVQKRNRELTVARRDFTERVETAIARKDPAEPKKGEAFRYRTKKEKADALEAILNDAESWKNDPTMCMQVFSACRELGLADKMIGVYENAGNEEFRTAPMVREQLAGAYVRKAKANAGNADEAAKDLAEASKICTALIDGKEASSVSYAVLSQCQKPAEAKETLEKGFKEKLDPFIGLQAVQANLRSGSEADKAHAQELAKVVYLSALRDGAEETTDFYTLSAALQTAVIANEKPETIEHFTNRIAKSVEHPWELEELKRNMTALEKAGINVDAAKTVQGKIGEFEKKNEAVAGKEESGLVVLSEKDSRTIGNDSKLEALHNHSYNYRGCGSDFRGVSRVGGNMEFGGQLPSHTVSAKDLELFTGLVNSSPEALGLSAEDLSGIKEAGKIDMKKPLADIRDPKLFMQVTDKFVRKTFMTENYAGSGLHLEDNALEKGDDGKSVYDRTVIGKLETCGKESNIRGMDPAEQQKEKKYVDTRTNIAAIFAMGMGDCRHHAQAKQIMFDMYQRQQMNECLSKMVDTIDRGETVDIQDENGPAKDFYKVLDTELRTSDIKVMLPVEMKQERWDDGSMHDMMYQPALTKDGKFAIDSGFDAKAYQSSVRDGNGSEHLHCLEEHTFCWLIEKNRQGGLEAFSLRDAFYQTEGKMYQWGQKDIDLSAIHTDGGKLEIDAGIVTGDKSNTGEAFPVYLRPAGYNSGKRDQKVMSSTGRDICMVGIEVAGFDTTESFIGLIRAGKEKTDALNVMQADGKAVVAKQAVDAARKSALRAEKAGDHKTASKQQDIANDKESAFRKDKKAADIKRNAAATRRQMTQAPRQAETSAHKTSFYKDLMKFDKDRQEKGKMTAILTKRNGKQK